MQEVIANNFQSLEDELVAAIKEGQEGTESLSLAKLPDLTHSETMQPQATAALGGTDKSVMSDAKSNIWRRSSDLTRQYQKHGIGALRKEKQLPQVDLAKVRATIAKHRDMQLVWYI